MPILPLLRGEPLSVLTDLELLYQYFGLAEHIQAESDMSRLEPIFKEHEECYAELRRRGVAGPYSAPSPVNRDPGPDATEGGAE